MGGLVGAPWSAQWFARAPGEPIACPRESRSTRAITLWNATQAQRDHKIIHARNFCVQPQAFMGSGIVEYVVCPLSVLG